MSTAASRSRLRKLFGDGSAIRHGNDTGPSPIRLLRNLGKQRGPRRGTRTPKARRTAAADGDQKEQAVVMDATVSQALPNAMLEVELENGHKLIAYAAGRMRRYFIRLTPGDRIPVQLSPYDPTPGPIVHRHPE